MKYSISISKGKGNLKHNKREQYKQPRNVDKERSNLNLTLIDHDIEEMYKSLFKESVDEYNDKQKRNDRKIKNYYKKILNDKKTKPFHELVIQVGNREDQIENIEKTNQIYREFIAEFIKHNPNLRVIGAYVHNDESTPHMHIDYVPIAKYNRGLKLRVSNDKAIQQMNFTDWKDWHSKQMNLLEKTLNNHHYERDNMKNISKHIERVDVFREKAQRVERLANAELEKIQIEEPKVSTNPLTKRQTVSQSLDEYKQHERSHELEKARLTALNDSLSVNLEKSDSELKKTKNALKTLLNRDSEQVIQKLTENNQELEEKNKELKNKIYGLIEKMDDMYSQNEIEKNQLRNDLQEEVEKKYQAKIRDLNYELDFEKQKATARIVENQKLKSSNQQLTQQVDTFKSEIYNLNIQKSQFEKEIKTLKERLNDMCISITNVTKAIKSLIYDNSFNQNQLDQKQTNLIHAIRDYVVYWLKDEEKEDLASEAITEYGFSNGIKKFIQEYELPNDLVAKGGNKGRGLYKQDSNGNYTEFYAELNKANELKTKGVKIRDPYEILEKVR